MDRSTATAPLLRICSRSAAARPVNRAARTSRTWSPGWAPSSSRSRGGQPGPPRRTTRTRRHRTRGRWLGRGPGRRRAARRPRRGRPAGTGARRRPARRAGPPRRLLWSRRRRTAARVWELPVRRADGTSYELSPVRRAPATPSAVRPGRRAAPPPSARGGDLGESRARARAPRKSGAAGRSRADRYWALFPVPSVRPDADRGRVLRSATRKPADSPAITHSPIATATTRSATSATVKATRPAFRGQRDSLCISRR